MNNDEESDLLYAFAYFDSFKHFWPFRAIFHLFSIEIDGISLKTQKFIEK